jgi:CRP/FNR family transcriptional regulator, cyclic AMP receptor protein
MTTSDPKSLKIEIDHVMPGADIVRAGGEEVALGFPEEVVKAWMQAKKSPTAWLIPDVRQSRGIVQWALEFPLYFALFLQGMFGKGKKLTVLVKASDWPDVVEYLRLTLLGLTEDEMNRESVAPGIAKMLAAESASLALKHKDGTVARIEDFLAPKFFDAEGVAQVGDLKVKAHGNNTWSFYTAVDRLEEYRLDVDGVGLPPYTKPLTVGNAPILPQPFEIVTLGTTNGFDPTGPCSNMLVQANGRFVLVDCGPYIRALLKHSGVSLSQINAVILTHAHEDHAVGLSTLLDLTHRVRLFVTRENAAILRKKLAILNPKVTSPATLLEDAFDVTYVEPAREYDYLGLKLKFHYAMHSIPCTGVELAMKDAGGLRKALLVGDNNSRANIEKARATGVIDDARLASLQALYAWQGDLIIFDAGAGLIHGMPADFKDNASTSVVCVHTGTLKEEERHLYTLAEPGHRYTIVPEASRPTPLERGLAHKALVACFGDCNSDWLDALLDAATPISVNRGHVVVRKSDRTADVFVTLTGELAVITEQDGKPRRVAVIQAGELFGEMSAVTGGPRSASVMAETPARVLRIPADTFRGFAEESKLPVTLPDLWQKRRDLEAVVVLEKASVTTRNLLSRHSVRRTLAPGTTLIREGSRSDTVYVLVRGRVQVYKGTEPLLVAGAPVIVDPGTLIGETAPFLKQPRNASIVAVDECEVLAIRGVDFKRIVQSSPQLFCVISTIVKSRSAA